jgi:Flp pilus assembly protein TadG
MNCEKSPRNSTRTRRRQRGVATVEFGLYLPVVAMLMIGAFDFGRAYYHMQVLLEAAQSGVRIAALPSSTPSSTATAANAVLVPAGLAAATITSSNVGSSAVRGSVSSVTVSIPFTTMTGTMVPGWIGVKTMTKTAKMRHE